MSSSNLMDRVSDAAERLRAGDSQGALSSLATILDLDPDHEPALGLLAIVRESRGEFDEALAVLDRALSARPEAVNMLAARGRMLLILDRAHDALIDFDRAIEVDRESVATWFYRAKAQERLERFPDALASYQTVLQQRPGEPAALAGTAFCLAALGRDSEALDAYAAVLRLLPNELDIRFNHARCLEKLNRHAEALESWDRYLQAKPADREAQVQRAVALFGLDRIEEALAALDNLDPSGGSVEVLANRGLFLLGLGEPEKAWEVFETAVRTQGVQKSEHSASLRYHRGLSALSAFDFARGWPDYEARWATKLIDPPALSRDEPAWDGAPLPGILRVWREQPIGDEILFSRLVPLARARATTLILECSARLVPLFERSFPGVQVRAQGNVDGAADAQVSIASLGAVLGAGAEALDGGAPYLKADMAKAAEIRNRYEGLARGRPIVGISWHSNNQKIGGQKSAPLVDWGALLSKDFLFVNLQYGPAASDAMEAGARFGCEIVTDPAIDQLADLDAFAAQVRAMDHVVSVSNTTVHFAGALGVPCTVVAAPGRGRLWYWGCAGEITPWYASVRIARRSRGECWANQFAVLADWLGASL